MFRGWVKQFFLKNIQDIEVDLLLHQDDYRFRKEGYGGEAYHKWPIFHFFKEYFENSPDEAKKIFVMWYIEQYQKYRGLSKKKGGMHNGSLDRLVKKKCKEKYSTMSKQKLESIVDTKVQERFELAYKIKETGYITSRKPVEAIQKGNNLILVEGHHRVAILAALNYKIVPHVLIWKSSVHRKLWRMISHLFVYLGFSKKK